MIHCPFCNEPLHEVFYSDKIQRWRCMNCDNIFSSVEWTEGNGELIKVRK